MGTVRFRWDAKWARVEWARPRVGLGSRQAAVVGLGTKMGTQLNTAWWVDEWRGSGTGREWARRPGNYAARDGAGDTSAEHLFELLTT